ncbi:MAG: hypothetical protein FJ278_09755, partial [Planctomycetes bacterium]|nr:hypothetical protein [Planctomycetota bacterium]
MPSRILLINPCIHDFTAYDLWMKPLGLLYVAAALERAGYDVRLVDCLDKYHPGVLKLQGRERPRLKQFGCGKFFDQEIEKPPALRAVPRRFRRFGITPDLFRAELRHGPTPQLIFVTSMMTYWYPGVFEAIRLARETFPSAPIALGGIYATLCPDHARKHSGADFVLEGPGEAAAADLAGKIGPAPAPGPAASALSEKTRRISNVQHRMSNDEGDVHVRSDNTTRGNGQHGGPNLFGTSLASAPNKLGTPTPGAVIGGVTSSFDIQDSTFDIRRLRPPELYPAYHLMRHLDSVSVLTSRGCPFRCTYCASSTLWPGFQQREPRQVADEIEHHVQRFNVRDIAFYDDALLVNAERHILPILSLVRERGLKARF